MSPAPDPALDVVAFYLPQFHPIPENDTWWGKGFTEWTNVVRTTPRYPGHYQPHLPADLGFYDLRVPEVRQLQAALARAYGVTAFCYYHYWFAGRRILERPFNEVLASGRPDFPFMLCWANENWTRVWDGGEDEILLEQDHSLDDDIAHLRSLLPAFEDPRYVRVQGKPVFLVYRASLLPDVARTLETWRAEARRHGVGELYLCRVDGTHRERAEDLGAQGFDAAVDWIPDYTQQGRGLRWGRHWGVTRRLGLSHRGYGDNLVVPYERVVQNMLGRPEPLYRRHPCVTPSWDNSARRAQDAFITHESTPELYAGWLEQAVRQELAQADAVQMVFVNAWNEWAEGNHLEPDQRWGRGYLEAHRAALQRAGALGTSGSVEPR